ncbi:MAG: imidazolonepropionase [Planctomycetia bacterium TMED53]|nr:MAG: imidazolonepropionase [Planctomycetia bacterium TMED53]
MTPEPIDLLLSNANRVISGKSGVHEGVSIAIDSGKIKAMGPASEIAGFFHPAEVVDATGKLVTPGFVDSHTHIVFGGHRASEFVQRCAGADYEEIAASGGGIRSSVRMTREASLEDLIDAARPRLARMVAAGSTTIEIKSGYGLDLETELKMLRAIAELAKDCPAEVVATFMGAHETPDEWRHDRAGYLDLVCQQMIPAVAKEGLAEFCDVFCERQVFDPEESRRVLETGLKHGLKAKIHADEMAASGGSEVAAEVGAISADHLMMTPPEGIEALKRSGVVATLLPGTTFYLSKPQYAPAREMIDAGLTVALATDRNPGSCTVESMLFIVGLAVQRMRMTPLEAIQAATFGGAKALGREESCGSLEVGKRADLILWEVPDEDALVYEFTNDLKRSVWAGGRLIADTEVHS